MKVTASFVNMGPKLWSSQVPRCVFAPYTPLEVKVVHTNPSICSLQLMRGNQG